MRIAFSMAVVLLSSGCPPGASARVTAATIDPGNALRGLACPSTTECVTLDNHTQSNSTHFTAREVTFDPLAPGHPGPVSTNLESGLSLACPLPTQCTAAGDAYQSPGVYPGGYETTFNPLAPGVLTPALIDKESGGVYYQHDLIGLACPTSTQCTGVTGFRYVITFNPTNPSPSSPDTIDPKNNDWGGIACPLTTQCTAVGEESGTTRIPWEEVSFDPTAPQGPVRAIGAPGFGWAISCPLPSQCTSVGTDYTEATFNPASPGQPQLVALGATSSPAGGGGRGGRSVASGYTSVSCPSATQCTAIAGQAGDEVTFNPKAPGRRTIVSLDSAGVGAHPAEFVACPSTTECVVVDAIGRELTFDPTRLACTAPNLKRRSLAQLAGPLTRAACKLGTATRRRSRTVAKGHVISQSPQPGKRASRGVINVVISSGYPR